MLWAKEQRRRRHLFAAALCTTMYYYADQRITTTANLNTANLNNTLATERSQFQLPSGIESFSETNTFLSERSPANDDGVLTVLPNLTETFQRKANIDPSVPEVVVTVFDVEYAKVFANFVAMCAAHGLRNVVGLALSRDALEMASYDVAGAGVVAKHVNIIYDGTIASYIAGARPGENRWHRIGHSKLIHTLAGLEAGHRIFVIEVDVVVLKRPSLQFPKNGTFDVISMSCPTRALKNLINLGFQLWYPTNNTLGFFRGVVNDAVRRQTWDQGLLNEHYHKLSQQRGAPPVRMAPLNICVPDPHWSNADGILPFVREVFEVGSASGAAARDSHTAIHIIGKRTLSKTEWMAQGHVLEVAPYGRESFLLLGGTPPGEEGYRRAVHAAFALGAALGRTPILPRPRGGLLPHECLDVEKLRSCGGGYKLSPFLHGHLFLNRTEIPNMVHFCGSDSAASQLRQLPKKSILVIVPAKNTAGAGCNGTPALLSDEDRDSLSRTGQRAGFTESWDETSLSTFLEQYDLTGVDTERTLSCVNESLVLD